MKCLLPILTALLISNAAFAQKSDSIFFQKGSFLFGFAFGTKSHTGNWGLTINTFLSKNVNIKLSAGGGQFNYNGFLISLGPEYCGVISKNKFLLLGSVWSFAGGTRDVIDDESATRREYQTHSNQYIRTYAGIGFVKGVSVFKIEAGYSYALYTPQYTLYQTWTPDQEEQIRKGMNSGLLVNLSVQFNLDK
jgi:hypothetical protein